MAASFSGANGEGSGTASKEAKQLMQTVDEELVRMEQSFTQIVAQIEVERNQFTQSRKQYQLEMLSMNMVRSTQVLLAAIAQLKQSALTRDFEAIGEQQRQRVEILNARSGEVAAHLALARDDVGGIIDELSQAYNDRTRVPGLTGGR